MNSTFIIKDFNKYSEECQQEIQDFISGLGFDWDIFIYDKCSICNKNGDIDKYDCINGEVYSCKSCLPKISKFIKTTGKSQKTLIEVCDCGESDNLSKIDLGSSVRLKCEKCIDEVAK